MHSSNVLAFSKQTFYFLLASLFLQKHFHIPTTVSLMDLCRSLFPHVHILTWALLFLKRMI